MLRSYLFINSFFLLALTSNKPIGSALYKYLVTLYGLKSALFSSVAAYSPALVATLVTECQKNQKCSAFVSNTEGKIRHV